MNRIEVSLSFMMRVEDREFCLQVSRGLQGGQVLVSSFVHAACRPHPRPLSKVERGDPDVPGFSTLVNHFSLGEKGVMKFALLTPTATGFRCNTLRGGTNQLDQIRTEGDSAPLSTLE